MQWAGVNAYSELPKNRESVAECLALTEHLYQAPAKAQVTLWERNGRMEEPWDGEECCKMLST